MNIKIFDYQTQQFIETNIPMNKIIPKDHQVITCVECVAKSELEKCIKSIMDDNKDIGFTNFIYDGQNGILYISADNILNTSTWLDMISKKPIVLLYELNKVFDSNDSLDENIISLKDVLKYFYQLAINTRDIAYTFYVSLLAKAKEIYPNIRIKINDLDYEYKDLFFTINIDGIDYDYNVSQFEDEFDIENYNDDQEKSQEIIDKLLEIGKSDFFNLFSNCDKAKIFQDFDEQPIYPLNSNLKVILSSWITITNNYKNNDNRYYLLSLNLTNQNDKKICAHPQIRKLISDNTDEILSNIFLKIKDFPFIFQNDLSAIRKQTLDDFGRTKKK